MKWYTEEDLDFYFGQLQEVEKYNKSISERRYKFPHLTAKYADVIEDIKKDGYCIIPGVFSGKIIQELKEQFEQNVKYGNVSSDDEYYTMISDPLYNSRASFEIATSDIIFEIASEFYKCTPALCTQNFRLSKLNRLSPKTTQMYHADQNSIKFLKFFVYINDVHENGGPFTYVRGSNARKFKHHLQQYRWTDDEIENLYGIENKKLLTAKAGDLIIAQTTGYHKGSKPLTAERYMLTLNYVIHEENGMTKKFLARKEWVDSIEETKKPLFDFMELK
jgi:hypothetical protein